MPSFDETTILAFCDQLRKEAGFAGVVARAAPALKGLGAGGGFGALAGGGVGAMIGASRHYESARDQGAGVGQAAMHGISGGLQGGLTGAAAGGVLGAGAGALRPGAVAHLTADKGIAGAFARSGQRQVHSVTGMLTPGELEGIRGGAHGARQTLGKAQDAVIRARAPGSATAGSLAGAEKTEARAAKGLGHAEDAQRMGMTSVPGYLGAMKEHGVGKVLSTSAKEQFYNMPTALGTAMVGLPLAQAAGTLTGKESPEGPGKGEQVGRNLGSAVGNVLGGAMPFVGSSIVGGALGAAGGGAGKGIDHLRGRRPAPITKAPPNSTLDPTEAQSMPTERGMSASAAGQQKDVGI